MEVLTLSIEPTYTTLIKIVPFISEYAIAFKELNTAWLEKYFYVEAKDISLLENSKENILDKGGYIFMALYNSTPVGCFSFIPLSKNIYELGKMAVSNEYQGKKSVSALLTLLFILPNSTVGIK
ncbi:GNAT family N-acetyltransferase [Maribacter aestuarii]|uniref:GNAT family N-acetyltransferase n=1 Tax=Maribacter aestuarii TaxID=1130723 RepID=UPI0032214DC6